MLGKTEVKAGETVDGVIQLDMEEGWHTYWRFAGDVGLPTKAQWELPPGWEASELEFPAPDYLETEGLVSYGYEHEVQLPFTLTVPAEAELGQVELKVKLKWLECKGSCIPGKATLTTNLTVGESSIDSEHVSVLEEARSKLPKPGEFSAVRDGVDILLELPAGSKEARFFPDAAGQIKLNAPQSVGGEGKPFLRLKRDQEAEKPAANLSGLLVADGKSYQFSTLISAEAAAPTPPEPASALTVVLTMLAAFAGGMVLNLMPCVFPVLGLKVLGIVEQARAEGSKPWQHGLVFTFGVLVSFWILSGALLAVRSAGEEVGWGYQLQNPLMIGGLAVLFLLIALNLFGVFEVGESLTQLSNVADQKHGFASSFWSGVLTTLAATPCTAPFMGSAVGFALSQSTLVAFAVFTALALGVSAPYMLLTMFPALLQRLPRPGAWMVTFKQILAFPMLLAVVWLSWVFGNQVGTDKLGLLLLAMVGIGFATWIYGKWGSSLNLRTQKVGTAAALIALLISLNVGYHAAQPDTDAELWLEYSPELVTQLKQEGKPFFLDFTADWCTSCKANELIALSSSEVQEKFQELGVTLVKADWTKSDPVITAALDEFNRAGVPLYVLYPGQGADPEILPEILSPGIVLDALDKVKRS